MINSINNANVNWGGRSTQSPVYTYMYLLYITNYTYNINLRNTFELFLYVYLD